MKVKIKKDAIVKCGNGTCCIWPKDDKIYTVINKGKAILLSDNKEVFTVDWDNLVVVEHEPETIS